jgi:hypothetical protein
LLIRSHLSETQTVVPCQPGAALRTVCRDPA